MSSCASIELLPAIVTVLRSDGGAGACDATFAISEDGDAGSGGPTAGAVDCHGGVPYGGCPADPVDGAPPPCQYAIEALTPGVSYTVQVSEPGYASATLHGVVGGTRPCSGASTASTEVTVTLTSNPSEGDAGS